MELSGSKWFSKISKLQDLHNTWKREDHSKVFYWKSVRKKFTYDSTAWKECNKKKVQHEKRGTQKKQRDNNAVQKKEQHENSTTREKSNMKRMQ